MDWRRLLLPGLAVLLAFLVLVSLGLWQLERRISKTIQIAAIADRAAAAPTPLPRQEGWAKAAQRSDEFRRVSVRVAFIPGREARVYAGAGGGLREDVKGPGYFAFAPARRPDGATVVVNRGYVAHLNPDASLRPIAVPDGAIEIVGSIRFPERPSWFIPSYSDRQDLWFVRDHRAMAAHYGWGEVAPFYIEQESPRPPGGVPQPGPLTVRLRNDHFGYAMTWFGLAAVLLVSFGFWVRSRRRELSASPRRSH